MSIEWLSIPIFHPTITLHAVWAWAARGGVRAVRSKPRSDPNTQEPRPITTCFDNRVNECIVQRVDRGFSRLQSTHPAVSICSYQGSGSDHLRSICRRDSPPLRSALCCAASRHRRPALPPPIPNPKAALFLFSFFFRPPAGPPWSVALLVCLRC